MAGNPHRTFVSKHRSGFSARKPGGSPDDPGPTVSIGDERRASVYRSDVAFAPEDRPRRAMTEAERAPLVARLRELKAAGVSHLDAAALLEVSAGTVNRWCRDYEIKTGPKSR